MCKGEGDRGCYVPTGVLIRVSGAFVVVALDVVLLVPVPVLVVPVVLLPDPVVEVDVEPVLEALLIDPSSPSHVFTVVSCVLNRYVNEWV